MSHTNITHRRTHNLLLISKLLSQRDAASPFTLVLDTLEQTAKPVLGEYIRRANACKTQVVFLGFETVRKPSGVNGDGFVACYGRTPGQVVADVRDVLRVGDGTGKRHYLLVIDSLYSLCTLAQQAQTVGKDYNSNSNFNLTEFLSSLIAPSASPSQQQSTTSLVAVYHTDIPLSRPSPSQSYVPSPLTLLTYLATTVLTVHSLASLLSAKAAQSRSLAPPVFGLDETKEGVLIGQKPARFTKQLPLDQRGVVLELEHRRKSGRGVREWYFLPQSPGGVLVAQGRNVVAGSKENVILLDDHPLFRPSKPTDDGNDADRQLSGLTFELGLTERQRVERDGVVLPYFDAQRDGGGLGSGEGGRILYDMGVEDDFDEDEDEI